MISVKNTVDKRWAAWWVGSHGANLLPVCSYISLYIWLCVVSSVQKIKVKTENKAKGQGSGSQ